MSPPGCLLHADPRPLLQKLFLARDGISDCTVVVREGDRQQSFQAVAAILKAECGYFHAALDTGCDGSCANCFPAKGCSCHPLPSQSQRAPTQVVHRSVCLDPFPGGIASFDFVLRFMHALDVKLHRDNVHHVQESAVFLAYPRLLQCCQAYLELPRSLLSPLAFSSSGQSNGESSSIGDADGFTTAGPVSGKETSSSPIDVPREDHLDLQGLADTIARSLGTDVRVSNPAAPVEVAGPPLRPATFLVGRWRDLISDSVLRAQHQMVPFEEQLLQLFSPVELQSLGVSADAPSKVDFFNHAAEHWEDFISLHANKLVPCIRYGIPDDLRGKIWQWLVIDGEARQRRDRYFGLYDKLKVSPSVDDKAISRDLHRTFPKVEAFVERGGEGQTKLSNVLNAYANFDHKVGYAQGMAFVAGLLLMHMDEEMAFWTFVSLMQDPVYHLRILYGHGVGGLHLMMFQVDTLVKQQLPEVWAHLNSEGFGVDVYGPPFIPSLFIGRVSIPVGARIMDLFMSEGLPIIPRLFLGLLQVNKAAILGSAPDRILDTLYETCGELDDLIDVILRIAFCFPVTHATLEDLERQYWRKLQGQSKAKADAHPMKGKHRTSHR
eukprot:GGOE01043211.1.p1 GENE.GGOE01043211.1~~GGOE01043211.1.p1  ORF type:complete len:617 (+),score=160.80 GGOE01043211.1:31-1851(+)